MLRYTDHCIVFQEIPNEVTLAINISNCPNRCKGCHSPYLMDNIGEPLNEEVLSQLLCKYGASITCVCFMGGDADPKEIDWLAFFLRNQAISPVKVGWYSGRDKLPIDISIHNFDYIKIGPYIEKLGGLKSSNTNQRLYQIIGGELKDITNCFWKN